MLKIIELCILISSLRFYFKQGLLLSFKDLIAKFSKYHKYKYTKPQGLETLPTIK